jgi:NAD(P)-dependent dehydrogenase (short-subunit alcohol dehydrogenase family)
MSAEASKRAQLSRRLEGRIAIVTGGNKGMGRTISFELAREGADVAVIAGHNLDGAQAVVGEIEALGQRGLALLADVTTKSSVDRMVEDVAARFGRVDILVNNAGGGSVREPLERLSEQDWDRVFALNTKGTFLCSAAVARCMIEQRCGVIINVAGASAHRSYPRYGAFGPSKAAVISLTRQASLEWAPYGIRVNGVSPGPIRDPDTQWQKREPELAKEVLQLPMQRAGTRLEVARTVVYLASDDSGYVTGQMIIVDGGGVNTWYLSASTSRREAEETFWG